MPKKDKDKKEKKTEETKVAEEAKAAGETAETEGAEGSAEQEAPGEKDEKDAKIAALEEELAASKDKYMRLAAEYDNYRKRTQNEKLALYDDATAKAVNELLPVADSARMAAEKLKDASPEILKGVELISDQIDKSFNKLKIEAYGEVGDEFDPQLHNAVSMVDSDELESNRIANVFQKGYKIGDKIIRHAMVQVVN